MLTSNGKYLIGKLLGKGCSGVVHQITRVDDSSSFALKTVSSTSMEENAIIQAFREASIMKRISTLNEAGHDFQIPWIVKLEDFWVDDGDAYGDCPGGQGIKVSMVLELVTGPSLEFHLERLSHPRMKKRNTGGFSKSRPGEELSEDDEQIISVTPEQVYLWMSQTVIALSLLHKLGVVHRDIKPANLILSSDLRDIKIADFSISRVVTPGDHSIESTAGTLNYAAPEVLQGKPYGETCDMWSLGCVLFEIMTLQKAFKVANTSKILSMITRREVPTIPDDSDPGLVMLCNRLMNPDPTKRPTAIALCKHPRLKTFVSHELSQIHRRANRSTIIEFLDLAVMVPKLENLYDVPMDRDAHGNRLTLFDESNHSPNCAIEDQFDDDIGYEIFVLMQGSWILENSNRRVQVTVEGRLVTFSDGRAPYQISRAWQKAEDGPVEWMLGKETILIKSLSSFVSPQKLFFSRIQEDNAKRSSGLHEACMVLIRDDPLSTVYLSSASTASS